jgi:hypothetical protein
MAYLNLYVRFYSFRQEAGAALRALWHLSSSRFYLVAIVLIQALNWFQAIFIYRHLSGELLVLHYNIDFGIDLVGAPWRIFLYPLCSLGIFLLNWLAAASLHHQSQFRLFANLLLSAAIIFATFVSLALMFVYLINFR